MAKILLLLKNMFLNKSNSSINIKLIVVISLIIVVIGFLGYNIVNKTMNKIFNLEDPQVTIGRYEIELQRMKETNEQLRKELNDLKQKHEMVLKLLKSYIEKEKQISKNIDRNKKQVDKIATKYRVKKHYIKKTLKKTNNCSLVNRETYKKLNTELYDVIYDTYKQISNIK